MIYFFIAIAITMAIWFSKLKEENEELEEIVNHNAVLLDETKIELQNTKNSLNINLRKGVLKDIEDKIVLHTEELLYLDHGFEKEAEANWGCKSLKDKEEQLAECRKDMRSIAKDGDIFCYDSYENSGIVYEERVKIGKLVAYDMNKAIKDITREQGKLSVDEAKAKAQIEFDRVDNSIPFGFKISNVYKSIAFCIIGYSAEFNAIKQEARQIEIEEYKRIKEIEVFESKKAEAEAVIAKLEISDGDSPLVAELKAKIVELSRKIKKRKGPIGKGGWMYVVSDPRIKNCFKIGLTRRDDPMERVNELASSAGLPFKLNLHALFRVPAVFDFESNQHRHWAHYISCPNKEWFHVGLNDIEKYINELGFFPEFKTEIWHEKYEMSKMRLNKINIEI